MEHLPKMNKGEPIQYFLLIKNKMDLILAV